MESIVTPEASIKLSILIRWSTIWFGEPITLIKWEHRGEETGHPKWNLDPDLQESSGRTMQGGT